MSELISHSGNVDFDSRYYKLMLDTLNTVYRDIGLDRQINHVLGIIGEFINVSRVYVFEDDFKQNTSCNTYEWCAEGTVPQIDELKAVPHSVMGQWHYMLENDGIIVANGLKELPQEIYDQLSVQGILSIVVLPLHIDNVLYGYIGFDECRNRRVWTEPEIEALKALSNLVVNLIARSKAEKKAALSQQMLRTVLDNIETPIYVTDMESYKILFANRKFRQVFDNVPVEGEICWQKLKRNLNEPCADCPCQKLSQMDSGAVYEWETFNELLGRWFFCTDSLITWTDGRKAHLQTALDITSRKEYEERLEFSASFDKMTGIYNRESGMTLLKDMVIAACRERIPITFCYLDLDGLKYVNDTFGHIEGDRFIMTVVDAIRSVVRTSDIFARFGGDEFMLALRACPLDGAGIVMKKIRKKLDEYRCTDKYPYDLSFSVGILEISPEMECDLDNILMLADQQMYAEKQGKMRK